MDDIRCGKRADLFTDRLDEFLSNGIAVFVAVVECHVRVDALPLDVVVKPAQGWPGRQNMAREPPFLAGTLIANKALRKN